MNKLSNQIVQVEKHEWRYESRNQWGNDETNKELNEEWREKHEKECTMNAQRITEWKDRRTNEGMNK